MTTAQRIVVDPVTRIEGHLRIEAQTDAAGKITQAYSAGTMVRGIEIILRGRDPRDAWAFAQRICGVCTLVHGVASVRSVEDALHRAIPGYTIPRNAELIRNLMIATQYVHDHVMHFYHLHAFDWVDVVSSLKADPKATSALAQSISSYSKSSPGYFADVQKKIKTFVDQGQLGIFSNAYWGHPAYKLPPEANLMAVAHYLEALSWQREVVKLHTIFGGKNPHPNFVVGGVPCAISVQTSAGPQRGGGGQAATAVNMVGLQIVQNVIKQMQEFVDQVYLPDLLAIASFYKDWGGIGNTGGNFMAFGDLPGKSIWDKDSFLIPRGVILNGDLSTVHSIDLDKDDEIQEFVSHSWYQYGAGDAQGLHPFKGETALNFTGPKPPYERQGSPADPGTRGFHPENPGCAGLRAVFHAGAHGSTGTRIKDHRRRDAGLVRRADCQHQGGRRAHLQRPVLGSFRLAKPHAGRGLDGGPARGALALDRGR